MSGLESFNKQQDQRKEKEKTQELPQALTKFNELWDRLFKTRGTNNFYKNGKQSWLIIESRQSLDDFWHKWEKSIRVEDYINKWYREYSLTLYYNENNNTFTIRKVLESETSGSTKDYENVTQENVLKFLENVEEKIQNGKKRYYNSMKESVCDAIDSMFRES